MGKYNKGTFASWIEWRCTYALPIVQDSIKFFKLGVYNMGAYGAYKNIILCIAHVAYYII